MIIIGIDPGVSGAVTVLNTYAFRNVQSLPLEHNTLSDIYLFLSEIRGGEPYRRAIQNHSNNISDVPRANHVLPIHKSIRKVRARGPSIALSPEEAMDNSMEIWLEEPGQIVVNSYTTNGPKGKNSTGALLAGMTASRKLGRSVGQWEGIAAALNISVNLVPPKKWQSALNCKTKGDKNISKNLAIKAFPFLTDTTGKSTITHSIADSLLIALYGYLQYAEPKYIPLSVKQLSL